MWGAIISGLLSSLRTGTDTSGITAPNLTDEMDLEEQKTKKKKGIGLGGLSWMGGADSGSTTSNETSGANDLHSIG